MIKSPLSFPRFLVIGLARSGIAVAKWLKSKGKEVVVWDDQIQKQQRAQEWGWTLSSQLDDKTALIQSPGIPLSHPLIEQAKNKHIPIFSDIDLFCTDYVSAPIIGITGTNGKSTTTALVGHILKENGFHVGIGGNIGIPVFDLSDSKNVYVLELSSFQLEISQKLPLTIAAWLNISEDHLDRHKNLEAYIQAKKRIFQTTQQAVIATDDVYSLKVAQTLTIPVVYVSQYDDLPYHQFLTLRGIHNQQNIAVAYKIARLMGLEKEAIIKAIQTFPGLEHRQQIIRKIGSIVFINDSKATNADAAEKALKTFEKIYWILGGRDKRDGIDPLVPYFSKIKQAFLIGEAQERFSQTLSHHVPYTFSQTLDKAIKEAYKEAQKNSEESVILFSPACASFDQFQDFEHRGNVFCRLVEQLV
ncbi:MAG: UDP-N-acetylmuramoyl-L-alanine--D-glutamate ligase [Proteobacteria bacterium]|nr:UDP-N-acetylmuramoyl-L-alanine--D-glutamate ligase [Pseudomonadota bacterium]